MEIISKYYWKILNKCYKYILFINFQMKYPLGLLILLFSIYSITDLAIKARYTRKRLTSEKHKRRLNN